jgi:hypothetical protein
MQKKLMGTLSGRLWHSTGPGAECIAELDMGSRDRGQRLQVGDANCHAWWWLKEKASEHLVGWGSREVSERNRLKGACS